MKVRDPFSTVNRNADAMLVGVSMHLRCSGRQRAACHTDTSTHSKEEHRGENSAKI